MALIGIVGAAAAFFMFGGLGSVGKTGTSDPFDAIPKSSFMAATLDFAELRRSPIYDAVFGSGKDGAPAAADPMRRALGVTALADACGFDPTSRVQRLGLSMPEEGERGEFGVAARVEVTRDELEKCTRSLAEKRGGHAETHDVGSFVVLEDTSGGERRRPPSPRLRARRPARRRQGHVVRRDARRRRPHEARPPRGDRARRAPHLAHEPRRLQEPDAARDGDPPALAPRSPQGRDGRGDRLAGRLERHHGRRARCLRRGPRDPRGRAGPERRREHRARLRQPPRAARPSRSSPRRSAASGHAISRSAWSASVPSSIRSSSSEKARGCVRPPRRAPTRSPRRSSACMKLRARRSAADSPPNDAPRPRAPMAPSKPAGELLPARARRRLTATLDLRRGPVLGLPPPAGVKPYGR